MKSIRLSAKTALEIRGALNGDAPSLRLQELIAEIDAALKPRRSVVAARERREEKQEAMSDELIRIRSAVLARAARECEQCGAHRMDLEVDHMFGGSNRKTLQSVFTCWALCFLCHRQKTNNQPGAAYWLQEFIRHCEAWTVACEQDDLAGKDGYARAADIARARLQGLEALSQMKHPRGAP